MQMFRFENEKEHRQNEVSRQKQTESKKIVLSKEDRIQIEIGDLKLRIQYLDINRVRELSLKLHELGGELRLIELAIAKASCRADDYRKKVKDIVKEGRQALIELLDELRKNGFLEQLESSLKEPIGILGTYDASILDAAEAELLNRLGIGQDEHAALKEVFSAYRQDRAISLREVLGEASLQLENCSFDSPDDVEKRRNRLRKVVHSSFDIFAGLGVAGINLLAYAATAGLLFDFQKAIQSWATGSSMALRGARMLSQAKES